VPEGTPAPAGPPAAAPAAEPPAGLDIRAVLAQLPHRWPFVLVDRVVSLIPGERAVGLKCVSYGEPWFQGHFPDAPVMPGVLIIEAFAQLACLLAIAEDPSQRGKRVFLASVDKARFRRPVVPGDRLELHVEKGQVRGGLWRFQAEGRVDGVLVAEATLMAGVAPPDDQPTDPST